MPRRARFVIVEETRSERDFVDVEIWTIWWLRNESTGEHLLGWDGFCRDDNGVRGKVLIRSVELAPDGLHVLVRHGRGQLQVVAIPGTEGLPPLSPWTPPPPLPVSAFGITIDRETDLNALIRDIAERRSPQLLVELYEQLRFTPRFEEFGQIVADGVDSADPRVRSAAMYFLAQYPDVLGFEELAPE